MMRFRLIAIIFITSFISFGQESLSLTDAVQLSLKQNYDILLTEKQVEVRKIQNTWGEAGRYPKVTLNIQQNNTVSDQRNNPTSFIQALLLSNSLEGGVNAGWTLFNGFRVRTTKERLEQLELQSEGTAALVVENTIQATILSYYGAKLQEEKLRLLKTVMDLSKDKLDYNLLKQDFGTAASIDVLQYESAYLTDSSNYLMQELAYNNALRNLNLVMGMDVQMEWNLTSEIEVPEETYDYSTLNKKMLSNNRNILNENINLELLQRDISLAKTSMYPVLSFNTGAQGSTSSFKIGDFDRVGGATVNYYANFTLNFTLYDGGKVKRGIKALKVQNEVNEIQMEQLKSNLSNELMAQLDLYESRKLVLDLSKQAFKVSEKNLNLAKLRENTGVVNSFMVRDIELAYLRAGINMIETAYNLIDAKTNITRLIGGIVDDHTP